MTRTTFLTLSLALLSPIASHAQMSPDFDGEAWRADLRVIATELPEVHPDLFFRLTPAAWDSAAASIDRRLPAMTRNEALVAFMELVAMVKDGHTSINPNFDPAAGVRYYPFQLQAFEDGLYVRSAAPEYAELAGARVVRIGRATAEEAMTAAARIIPHENEWWARAWAPRALGYAEILDGLGLADDPEALTLVVERDGLRDSTVVRPAGRVEPRGHNPEGPIDRTGWIDMAGAAQTPLWLRHPGRPYYAEFVPADGTLYVGYRGVVNAPHGPDNAEFWRGVFAMADSLPVKRLVLDIRGNNGGESAFNRQVIRGILARPELDRADRLFVVIGRMTFSAAMNLTLDLEAWTNATFVGEPTGNATMFFGDHDQVRLPASGLTANVSTLPWHPDDPRDTRDFIAPDLYTPMTAADYRAGVDPAMEAIRAVGTEPSLAEGVEAAVLAGNPKDAGRLLAEAAHDPLYRFSTPEAQINALGYRLLGAHQVAPAIDVFRLNTEAFPESANVWDSLGEALLAADRRDESIEAYRHALRIDPTFGPSRTALERLGVEP